MEARIFADAAICRIKGEPFTKPSTTGVNKDTLCGIIRFPHKDEAKASSALIDWLNQYKSRELTVDNGTKSYWGRAVAGWHN